ncbi:flavin reductase family protein [Cupriavidus sp. CV2]|uniref:flavin reductase family protein n=1 Tax=Cupriavidus ulmosensis TaxID=3065913 RepID=UPI00296B1C8D|nr:flavin reductase family protein [Cupriavidus sp. CV2]MDW3680539.1 flavin reductase family protein [Cupriavidus sp. CV2]
MHYSDYEALDISTFSEESRYKFLMGAVVPRPIALVTSLSADGVLNAAPFSQFVVISVTPSLLGIVVHEGAAGYKDTVRNILASGEYVINSVSESMVRQVQECAIPHPPDVSEIDVVGLHTLPSTHVAPARVSESLLQFECRLHRALDFGDETSRTKLLVGEVVVVHCASGVVSGHRVDHQQLNPLGRIAGRSYCKTGEVLDV